MCLYVVFECLGMGDVCDCVCVCECVRMLCLDVCEWGVCGCVCGVCVCGGCGGLDGDKIFCIELSVQCGFLEFDVKTFQNVQ